MRRTKQYSFVKPYVFIKVACSRKCTEKKSFSYTEEIENTHCSGQWTDRMNSCWTCCQLCTELFQFAQILVHAMPQPLLELLSFRKYNLFFTFQTIHVIINLYNKNPSSQICLHLHKYKATCSPFRLASNYLLLCPFLPHPK